MTARLTHLSLFSGIGGLDIAAEWAGFKTVGQCEWADYPTKVLEKHWPDVPRWRDIRTLTKESFHERTGLRTADIISGGFPCQPFSVAGKRRGRDDDRYLWPEMCRVIEELRPRWVVGENVAGIVNMALDTVLSDLEGIGYTCQAFIIPACSVDAPHRRDRVCIVASSQRSQRWEGESAGNEPYREDARRAQSASEVGASNEDGVCRNVAHAGCNRLEEQDIQGAPQRKSRLCQFAGDSCNVSNPNCAWELQPDGKQQECRERVGDRGRWPAQPGLGGMADGLPPWLDEPLNVPRIARGVKDRVGRLKCLGNAVVPQQFYPVFQAIVQIERRPHDG